MKIGFIGQGWIGKNYADDFEKRGYAVVRYGLEEPYTKNKDEIKECNITFVAVPTPTTLEGFDYSIVQSVLSLVSDNTIVVIKSTLLPGSTDALQAKYPHLWVFHSPEFLVEKTAAYDAAHPNRNIIGVPDGRKKAYEKAKEVLGVLPDAPYTKVMRAKEAELVKYGGNCFLYMKLLYMNLLYDVASSLNIDYEVFREALTNDPRIGVSHTSPVTEGKRGAGGHCFIKDFEAFRRLYREQVRDTEGENLLDAAIEKNKTLLRNSRKDLDLLEGVYGKIQDSES